MQLTHQQLEQFHQESYLAVGSLVDDSTLRQLRKTFSNLQAQWAKEQGESLDDYCRVLSQWTNLWKQHPLFTAQIRHPEITAIACQLLGVAEIQLFHDHLISKPPRHSKAVPWHQDYAFWPVDKPKALSAWLALDEVTEDSGCLEFLPGAHLEGEQAPQDFLGSDKEWGERGADVRKVPVSAGSVIFHSCLSWHTTARNQTDKDRRAFICIYMDANCRWKPSHSDWHPTNEQVSVAPGERFNRDEFPLIRT
jgi:ectoine hydroxylase-related dioxygenase (phytanoyl-CoA dioxygenase family)